MILREFQTNFINPIISVDGKMHIVKVGEEFKLIQDCKIIASLGKSEEEIKNALISLNLERSFLEFDN